MSRGRRPAPGETDRQSGRVLETMRPGEVCKERATSLPDLIRAALNRFVDQLRARGCALWIESAIIDERKVVYTIEVIFPKPKKPPQEPATARQGGGAGG